MPLRKSVDRNTMVFRWDFLNNDRRATFSKDQLGWMVSRIADPARSAEISRQIDAKFDIHEDQTLTMTERAFALSFLGGFAAILSAFDLVSLVILAIMTLILANTVAMAVRERTHEYGVLRAIGFPPGHIRGFILGESVLVAVVGGLVGIGLVYLLVNKAIGPALEDNMSGFFPYFRAPASVMLGALAAAIGLGVVAGIVPAMRASRLKVTDALRRTD
jgi:putative ABC transport system permease protein